jgi:SnoaL-like polyketide cyclase
MKLSLTTMIAVLALTVTPVTVMAETVPASVLAQLKTYQDAEATTNANLKTFDTLDFDVYSNQKWDRLKESHSADVLVHYPDGSTTKGLDAHVVALKPFFVFSPDHKVKVHPVKFGSGVWTGVIGVIEGSFTQPMDIGGGKSIAPTGKPFVLPMSTIGHWNKDGVMDEEYLFWDNAALMTQIQ